MATIDITRDSLLVNERSLDRALAYRGQLEVPLIHVVGVAFNPEEAQRELTTCQRQPHTTTSTDPLVGTFSEHGDRIFWDVQHPSSAVIIELTHDRYAKIIVEVPNAEATATHLQATLDRQRHTAGR